jgi:uroporphyrin-III C-methyltransferase
VREARAEAPAIIIIGEVVRESTKLAEVYREAMAISKK